jgi:hypothetical protein
MDKIQKKDKKPSFMLNKFPDEDNQTSPKNNMLLVQIFSSSHQIFFLDPHATNLRD